MTENVNIFDKPIYKKDNDLSIGDILETEYGDYDNWVKIVIDKIELNNTWTKITGHYLLTNNSFEGYQFVSTKNKVIGKVVD